MAFRPGWSTAPGLALDVLEVVFVSAIVATLATRAVSSWRGEGNLTL
jgi:hypothetical protein